MTDQDEQLAAVETTCVSTANLQTNQPPTRQPETYVMARITTPHGNWEMIEKCINDEKWYISYKEHGSDGGNPHFHVLLPGSVSKDRERIRKRLKTAGFSGNRQLAVKFYENGILQGIQYCSKEGPAFKIGGDAQLVQQWIDVAPEWEQQPNIGGYMKGKPVKEPHPDHFKLINYRNIERVTLRFRREHGIASTDLEDTLEKMHEHGWRLCHTMVMQGIGAPYYEHFTLACKGKTLWKRGRFSLMRKPAEYLTSRI